MTAAFNANNAGRAAEQAARASYGKLVAILAMQSRDLAAAEDALSEALVSALETWPQRGIPDSPEAWLITSARNRLRNTERSRQVREFAEPELELLFGQHPHFDVVPERSIPDDRLRLMFACSHPAIDPAARAPLILQTVLGLSAEQIALAFLVEPTAMSQRLVRAKARIRDTGLRFSLPEAEDMPERLAAVLDAIYAAFVQGWDNWEQPDAPEAMTGEAIWLVRLLVELLPNQPEPKGLLALMLYCSARTRARRNANGEFVPLDQQDMQLWDRTMIFEAEGLLTAAAQACQFGRYQCEAAIQSVHVHRLISGRINQDVLRTLYDLLVAQTGSIGAQIARAVVLSETGEPEAGILALDALKPERVANHQPYWVARSKILALLGNNSEARAVLGKARSLTRDTALIAHIDRMFDLLPP